MLYVLLVKATLAARLKRHAVDDQEAFCLDGSKPFVYVSEEIPPQQIMQTLVYFEPAPLCFRATQQTTLQECSRVTAPQFPPFLQQKNLPPILSSDERKNPMFALMPKVVIRGCDGSLYQGYRKNVEEWNGKKIFFRGSINMIGVVAVLRHLNVIRQKVILTGSGTGGTAALLWSDYFMLQTSSTVYSFSDSGLFPPVAQLAQTFQVLYSLTVRDNREVDFFPQLNCKDSSCFYPTSILAKLAVRHFIANSKYDSYALALAGVKWRRTANLGDCSAQDFQIADLFYDYIDQLQPLSGQSRWLISCSGTNLLGRSNFANQSMRVGGEALDETLRRWLIAGDEVVLSDVAKWPSNAACSGLQQDL